MSFSSSSEDLSMFAAAEEVRKKQLFVFQGEGGGVGYLRGTVSKGLLSYPLGVALHVYAYFYKRSLSR